MYEQEIVTSRLLLMLTVLLFAGSGETGARVAAAGGAGSGEGSATRRR